MRSLIVLLCLLAAPLAAQVERLDLGPHGRLTLYLPGEWRTSTTRNTSELTLTVQPRRDSVNAGLTFAVTFPETDRFDTKSRLKLRVEADCQGLAQESVEGKAYGREFSLTAGYGFYCNFTDPKLRGRPTEKGNYKVMSVGKVRLAPLLEEHRPALVTRRQAARLHHHAPQRSRSSCPSRCSSHCRNSHSTAASTHPTRATRWFQCPRHRLHRRLPPRSSPQFRLPPPSKRWRSFPRPYRPLQRHKNQKPAPPHSDL